MKRLMTTLLLSTALTAQATPIVNLFELGIKDAHIYDEVGKHNITTSVKNEKGTLAMYSLKRQDNPKIAYMLEIYQDDEAYQTHLRSTQYHYFLQKSPEILTDHKRKIGVVPQFLADKQFEQTAQTINNFVVLDIKPEFNQGFREAIIAEMTQAIQAEPDVLAIYALTDKENPTRWYFYEIYANESALQKFRQADHFQDYLSKTAKMVQNKERIKTIPTVLMNKGGIRFNVTR